MNEKSTHDLGNTPAQPDPDRHDSDLTSAEARTSDRSACRLGRWIAGGGLVVATFVFLVTGTAFAQSDTAATSLRQSFIERLAEKLGVTTDELTNAAESAANEIIDEAVERGDLTEEQGNRVRARIASDLPFFGLGHGHGGGFGDCGPLGVRFSLDTIAGTLGMSIEDLRSELRDGTPLTDIIAAQGSTVDEVVDALVADAESRLDQAVTDGQLTREQADEVLAGLSDRLTEMFESDVSGRPHHHSFRRWR
jgi:polyhydroxyalkanoate synthesis regulator phasin